MTLFYTHLLTDHQQLLETLEQLTLNRQEKSQALSLINQTIHHVVIDTILENLDDRHHQRIIARIQIAPDDRSIIDLINTLINQDIEQLLRRRLTAIYLDLLEDLRR